MSECNVFKLVSTTVNTMTLTLAPNWFEVPSMQTTRFFPCSTPHLQASFSSSVRSLLDPGPLVFPGIVTTARIVLLMLYRSWDESLLFMYTMLLPCRRGPITRVRKTSICYFDLYMCIKHCSCITLKLAILWGQPSRTPAFPFANGWLRSLITWTGFMFMNQNVISEVTLFHAFCH